MRSQADRDEVTLQIAGTLAFAVIVGAVAALIAWAVASALGAGADRPSVPSAGLLVGTVVLVGRLVRTRGRQPIRRPPSAQRPS